MTDSNVHNAIQFWTVLILLALCATFRAGRDGFSALVAPSVVGTIV